MQNPMPSEQRKSDDGVQCKGFAPSPDSGQDAAMGARERYTIAASWLADHIAIAVFGSAIIGGAVAAVTASMSALSAYAPFSYVVAGLVGAILSTLALWVLFAFVRWVRHGTIGQFAPTHGELDGAADLRGQTSAFPSQGYESPDITDAKTRLCTFVMGTLSPAIRQLNGAVRYGGSVVKFGFEESPIRNFAADGIQYVSASVPSLDVFVDVESIRSKSLVELEKLSLKHIEEYVRSYIVLHKVISLTKSFEKDYFKREFNKFVGPWSIFHQTILKELDRISSDTHYPRIAAFMNTSPFDGTRYSSEGGHFSPSEISEYVAALDQSAS